MSRPASTRLLAVIVDHPPQQTRPRQKANAIRFDLDKGELAQWDYLKCRVQLGVYLLGGDHGRALAGFERIAGVAGQDSTEVR